MAPEVDDLAVGDEYAARLVPTGCRIDEPGIDEDRRLASLL
jgi:hypothetical protein